MLPGWVSNVLGSQESHGALLGANKSSCEEIPCSATRNVTPTWATGLGAGTTKAQEKGPWLKMNQVRTWPRSTQGEQGLVGTWSRYAEPHPQGTRGDSNRVTEGVSKMPVHILLHQQQMDGGLKGPCEQRLLCLVQHDSEAALDAAWYTVSTQHIPAEWGRV